MKIITYYVFLFLLIFNFGCSNNSTNEKVTGTIFIDTNVDVNSWALIPKGEFLYGQHNIEIEIDYDYEIMITDVTNSQYTKYLNEAFAAGKIKVDSSKIFGYYPGEKFQGFRHEVEIKPGDKLHMVLNESGGHIIFDGQIFSVEKGFVNHPVVMVTWFGAKAYAGYYGFRLPLETEWEKAARGTDGRVYPWGDELEKNQAYFYYNRKLIQKIFGKHTRTSPVGFFNGNSYNGYQTEEAISPYGLYDMAGNVWQWTADDYPLTHLRYMRGGSEANYDYNLRVWARNNADPDFYSINVGFRCVRDIDN